MPNKKMVTKETIEQIRTYALGTSWTAAQINQAFDEYHRLGHKQPNDRCCPGCVKAVMNYWKHYIKEYDKVNG